jgi:hypothetical protein
MDRNGGRMTEQQQIIETLSSGPKSLRALHTLLRATMTLKDVLDALWILQDVKKVIFKAADGLYALGPSA